MIAFRLLPRDLAAGVVDSMGGALQQPLLEAFSRQGVHTPHEGMPRKRSYLVYNLVTTLLEQAGMAAIVLLVLPRLGIIIPVWLLVLFMALWAIYSYITYRMGEKVIGKRPVVGTEALIGVGGMTTTRLSPEGYVELGTEVWRARSIAGDIEERTRVTVADMKGLTLFVFPVTHAAGPTDKTPTAR